MLTWPDTRADRGVVGPECRFGGSSALRIVLMWRFGLETAEESGGVLLEMLSMGH